MSKRRDDKSKEEENLLLFFAENAQTFTAKEAEIKRAQWSQILETKRQLLSETSDLLDQYVIKLIHRCPSLLDGPVGFDWVKRHYMTLLQRVRIMPKSSKTY